MELEFTLGPFFAFEVHEAGSTVAAPWRPMREIVEDPDVLGERVAGVRAYLAATGGQAPDGVELRVAASVTHMGLTARLVSAALAGVVVDDALWSVDLHTARWQAVLGGAFPLSLPQEFRRPSSVDAFVNGPAVLGLAPDPLGERRVRGLRRGHRPRGCAPGPSATGPRGRFGVPGPS